MANGDHDGNNLQISSILEKFMMYVVYSHTIYQKPALLSA
jgi:hypothetical protein